MEILGQLGDLFLAAVPTVIIVFLFYLFMRWSFFQPMQRVLSERHKRVEGARQEAEASRVAVQEKLRTYNESMKKARTEIFVEQESARRRVLDERQTAVTAARATAQHDLQVAKQALAKEVQAVRTELEQSTGGIADEIAEAILTGGPTGPRDQSTGGGR